MLARFRMATYLSIVTAFWCWLLTAIHGIWSFGILKGYLNGGMLPNFPTIPVTYGSFFMYTFGAFAVPFVVGLAFCVSLPTRFHLPALLATFLIGTYLGAADLSFIYQLDFGTTWGPTEAVRALFFHPVITPFMVVFGLAGTASLTRILRNPNP